MEIEIKIGKKIEKLTNMWKVLNNQYNSKKRAKVVGEKIPKTLGK
jgi:hypothetical protein